MVVTQVQAAQSGVEVEANTQLSLQGTQEAEKHMHSLSGPEIIVDSVLQVAQEDLNALDNFEDAYLKSLKIFDALSERLRMYAGPPLD